MGLKHKVLVLHVWVLSQSCLTLCNSMDCSRPGFFVPHHLLEFAQVHVPLNQRCHPIISSSVTFFSFQLQSFPESGAFPMSQNFASGGQSIGASALKKQNKNRRFVYFSAIKKTKSLCPRSPKFGIFLPGTSCPRC